MQISNAHIYIQMPIKIPKCPFSQISENGAIPPFKSSHFCKWGYCSSKVELLTLLFSLSLSHVLPPLSLHFQMAEWPT
jgi:hypothetical protein